MRQKADKLEKGKWYSDINHFDIEPVLLKFSHKSDQGYIFSDEINGPMYDRMSDKMIRFSGYATFYLPTPEDIEKYNLNETE